MNTTVRRVCVVTGSRADYGPLRWLMRDLAVDPRFALSILATGTHAVASYGAADALFAADGIAAAEKVPCLLAGDDRISAATGLGLGVVGIAGAYARLAPDVVVVLGDRFEILAAAQAAMMLGIPIAHIHGGETTEGALDETIRHAITKMAHLHFAAAQPYADRIVRMGEAPERVFTVGAPGVDAIARVPRLAEGTVAERLGRSLSRPLFLVTFHPVTARPTGDDMTATDALFQALDTVPGASIVVTGVNADPGRDALAATIVRHVAARAPRVSLHLDLGQELYFNLVRLAAAVVGNSSSGLIEAPALGTPTVNIGDRQKGRLRAASVVDCSESAGAIAAALARVCDPRFMQNARAHRPPYGGGGTAKRIADILAATDLAAFRQKPFYDPPVGERAQ